MTIMIILPGNPDFYRTLATPPPGWRNQISSSNNAFFIARQGLLLEPCTEQEYLEYVNSGEFDENEPDEIENYAYLSG